MSSRKSNQRFMAWSIVAIILLLATSAWLYWNNLQLNKKLDLHQQELAAVESTQQQLEKDYEIALSSLEELKGDNKDLNALIDQQKSELKLQKDKISGLIWKAGKLDEAKKEIEKLKNYALEYVQEINQLKTEKENLLAENYQLITKTQNLQSTLEVVNVEKDSINREKDSIAQVKERLRKENQALAIKATRASVIEVEEIDITGYNIKDSGKLSKKRRAKNIQLLEVCFKMIPNVVAETGTEVFHIRIITPSGETMFKQQLGGGILNKAIDNTTMKYTFTANMSSPKQEEVACTNYEPKEPLQKGLYKIEVYNKNYLCGKGSFTLK